MKNFILLLFVTMIISRAAAQADSSTILGRWVGSYGNNEKNGPYYFSFEFKPDSSMVTYSAYNKIYGYGKYKIVKNKVSLTYRVDNDVQQYECSGLWNDSTHVLSGTWRRIHDVGTNYKYTQKGNWIMRPGN
jgi:hypothetical protein